MQSDAPLPRYLLAALLGSALVWGVVDMGERLDAVTLGISECFHDEEACIGQVLDLSYMRIVSGDEESFVLRGRGFDMAVEGWKGPPLPSSRALLRISVTGTYLGDQRMRADRGMVHRFRRLKELVGLVVLLLWMGAVVRFVRRRYRG